MQDVRSGAQTFDLFVFSLASLGQFLLGLGRCGSSKLLLNQSLRLSLLKLPGERRQTRWVRVRCARK